MENNEKNFAVNELNLTKYQGKWYQVGLIPNWFQRNCTNNVTAEYNLTSLNNNPIIEVKNTCLKKDGKIKTTIGFAKPRFGSSIFKDNNNDLILKPAILGVKFKFNPFYGKYYVIAIDENNYDYVMVGSPNKKYLWILSRSNQLPTNVKNNLLRIAKEKGFDISKIIF